MPIAAIGAIAAPMISGAIGAASASEDRDAAAAARKQALEQILKVNLPNISDQMINLQKQSVVGTLNPAMEGTITNGPSQMEGISTDPRLRQAQMQALATMQGLGNTGLSSADRAALMDIRNQSMGQANAAEQATLQNLASRGMAGGGQELAARMIAGQQGANMASNQGMQVAAQAQAKALQAIMNAGNLGGQMESKQFGEQSDVAKAQDAINQFNTANRQAVTSRNTQNQNQAQAANLANAQGVANSNTGTANQQEMFNKGLQQQQFGNQMTKAQSAANALNGAASQYQQQAAATQGMWSGIGQGAGSGLAALANYKPSTAKEAPAWGGNETDPNNVDFMGPTKP